MRLLGEVGASFDMPALVIAVPEATAAGCFAGLDEREDEAPEDR